MPAALRPALRRTASRSRSVVLALVVAATATLSVLALPAPAQAATLETYTLTGVTFADGGTASGWVEVGSDRSVRRFEMSVAGGDTATYPPTTYSSDAGATTYVFPNDSSILFFLPQSQRFMRLTTGPGLFDEAGTRSLALNGASSYECYNCSPFRTVSAGTLEGAASPLTPQTLSFGEPPTAVIGATWTPTVTGGGSGNPVVLSLDPSTTDDACRLVDGTVTFQHAGTCVVAADQAGDERHAAALTVIRSVTVPKLEQTLTAVTPAPATATWGQTYDAAVEPGGSSAPVVVSVEPSAPGVCTLDGTVVTVGSPGTCTVRADQDGDADHLPAATLTRTIEVVAGTPPTVRLALTSNRPAGRQGWHRTPVQVVVTCTAGTAPITSCPTGPRVTKEGTTRATVTATSADGTTATATRVVKVDRSKPRLVSVQRRLPENRTTVVRRCRGTDAVSAVGSCKVTWRRPSLRTDRWTFVAEVVDLAGNTSTVRGRLADLS